MTEDRDRTTIRRALRAAGVIALVFAVVGIGLAVSGSIGMPAVVATAMTAAAFVTAGWLLLSYLLDVLAGDLPGRRRTIWTIASVVVAMLAPFVLLGAFVGGSGGAR